MKASNNGVVNVASVPHRSPFRYPGGKTWLVPHVRRWLTSLSRKPHTLLEPFAGGAIVGLSALFENLVEQVALIELDEDVAAVWRTILNGKGEALARKIESFDLNANTVTEVLQSTPSTGLERAFATIVRNRVQRGGILAPGASLMNKGENGRGIASRWYPKTLATRIRDIVSIKKSISFSCADGIGMIQAYKRQQDTAIFIDPPYTVAGRRLYRLSEIDHVKLFEVVGGVAGDWLMTYDCCPEIQHLAEKFAYQTRRISMKNTHHVLKQELLIGPDLSWVDKV